MNKFKKAAIGAILAASAGCLAGAVVGCNGEPNYYKLTFDGQGVDYVFQGDLAPEDGSQLLSGYTVKEGVEVRFTLSLADNSVGTPVVKLNGEEIAPDADGVYSFVMSKETALVVDGLQEKKKVTFSTGEWYSFLDENGNELEELSVVKGESVKFKVWVSPYMKEDFTITNDTEELECDAEGFYTVSNVADNSTVNVNNLEQDDSFIERGEGMGTESDPFLIKRPIDMFMVAGLINNTFNSGTYSASYYKLENDIDMKGEKLFVIGDTSTSSAIFCGTFDGNGHTISNFKLTDEVTDQETYANEYLSFVGLFGYACATQSSPAVIKNLTLENGELEIHPQNITSSETASYAGLLLGYGIGVQIDGCNVVNGKVTSYNDNNRLSFVGGVVGVLQSAYNESIGSVLTYDAYVNGCSADVDVGGEGAIRAAGGIVGILSTADTHSIAYVTNCVTTGSVSGAMLCGGIAGTISRFSSVANCYSSCSVAAKNTIISNGTAASYRTAYAGGIVGFAENDTVISACYSANTSLKASAVNSSSATATGDFVGYADVDGTDAEDSLRCIEANVLKKDSDHTASVFTEKLGWVAEEWNFSGAVPAYTGTQVTRPVTITVKQGGSTVASNTKNVTVPVPLYAWYDEGDLDEYVENASGRSWGYYFDEALTKKVPYGYLPTANCDFYVGFADNSEVVGKYYFGQTTYGVSASITLAADGTYFFRDGGMSFKGNYSYDGETVMLYNSCFAALEYSADRVNGAHMTMAMQKSGVGYTLVGKMNVLTEDLSGSEAKEFSYTAIKLAGDFTYGEYVAGNVTMTFKEDGTGVYKMGNASETFTYTVTETGVEISVGIPVEVVGGKIVKINGKAASLKDGFAGSWVTSTGSTIKYVFDGFGVVKCGDVTGTYEPVTATTATITLGGKVIDAIMSDDALYIDGIAYYVADGFVGSWYGATSTTGETIELVLGGIGKNGYGVAEITYYAGVTYNVTGEYSVANGMLSVYVGDTVYGELSINENTGSAYGAMFSFKTYSTLTSFVYVNAEFKLYDLFKGVWECNLSGINNINFTGKTAGGTSATALLTGTDGKVTAVNYTTNSATTGTITIGGVTYNMTLNEGEKKVSLSVESGESGALAQRDAWYGVTLYDEDGISYKFDGKGNLGGKVTQSVGGDIAYVIGSDGMPVIDGTAIVATGNGFTWNGKTLTFKTGLANTWLLPETNGEVVIGEVGSDFTANVEIDGEHFVYTYNPARNTLTYSYNATNGVVKVTISALSKYEISIVYKGASEDSKTCISGDKLDTWGGKYAATDGSYWQFDGHGFGEYGKGTAVYVAANGKKTVYDYSQNDIGLIYIYTGSKTGMLFAEVSEGGYKKEGGAKAYLPVTVDTAYLTEVRFNGEYVVFDGVGNLLKDAEKTGYTYKMLSSKYYVLTDADGNKSVGTLTSSGAIKDLTTGDYVELKLASDQTQIYIHVGASLWFFDGENYSWKYAYEDLDGEIYLTDADNKYYLMTLNKNNNTFVLEEIENED